jgi:4-diphosphocytidyl-2-C-methyl-D-erythritol kinase
MIREKAPAKINWFLEITGKRPDGYHELSTFFQCISLADELSFRPAAALTLKCSDRRLPVDEGNLVMRAARRLQEALGETRGAAIRLRKVVPMGAGLGGGSSDAAATLLGLQKLWRKRLQPAALHRLATSLGADVPFFLKKGLCSARGIGEKLKALTPLPRRWFVLVYPDFGVSTKDAYAKVRLPFVDPRKAPSRASLLKGHGLFNRFESLVFPQYPALPVLKAELAAAGASAVLMSGSGSSVFGLADNPAHARRIWTAVRRQYPRSWVIHTQ